MLDACERHFEQLVKQGCSEDVAADRTFDAFDGVFADHACFDRRDALFQNELRTIAERN